MLWLVPDIPFESPDQPRSGMMALIIFIFSKMLLHSWLRVIISCQCVIECYSTLLMNLMAGSFAHIYFCSQFHSWRYLRLSKRLKRPKLQRVVIQKRKIRKTSKHRAGSFLLFSSMIFVVLIYQTKSRSKFI